MSTDPQIHRAREVLLNAQSVSVLTGAGISAESGIPTFRDVGGIWENFDPEQVATPEAFARDPAFVWKWYADRMHRFKSAIPNRGHQSLAELEHRIPEFRLVTQNIDNLHKLAGSRRVTELHGNIWRTRCLGCGRKEMLSEAPYVLPPKCSDCGQMLRPDVVWFGEPLETENIQHAEAACHAEVFIVAGTSGEVWPAAGFVHLARDHGACVIEINTQRTVLSEVTNMSLLGPCGEVLPQLFLPG